MSCYHPLLGIPVGVNDTGKTRYLIKASADNEKFERLRKENPDSILVPCGKCIGCRLDYSRSWADRMMLELETAKKAVFVTLTYDNDHAPWSQFDLDGSPMYASLDVRDCQLFMKRLRRQFEDVKIRFFLSGEYGPSTLRPHYHAILFGIGLDDFPDAVQHGCNELGQKYYISDQLAKIWSCGHVLLSDVSWKTCAYVARYVTKKLSGPAALTYAVRNVTPEFSLMSRKPGIGRSYLDDHPDCLDFASINLSTPDGGLKIQLPKYYLRLLDNPGSKMNPNVLYDPEKYAIMKEQRKKFAEDKMILKLQKTGLGYLDYLETEEQNKLASVKALKRSKI